MSMYAVNAGVPKTLLLRHLVWAGEALLGAEGKVLVEKIVQAPVSPELLPVNPDGSTDQSTEASIGPYLLQDFYLYHAIAKRRPPQTVYCLAAQAFNGTYSQKVILHWLRVFYQRFFNQQFKRSASPDGPQVTELSLSPRSAWQMPSDASPGIWLNDLDTLCHEGDIPNG